MNKFERELQEAIVRLQRGLEQVVKVQIQYQSTELLDVRDSIVKIQSQLMELIIKNGSE